MPTWETLLGDTVRVQGHMSERPEFLKARPFAAYSIAPCFGWQAIAMVIP
jgi:hypothetical protein